MNLFTPKTGAVVDRIRRPEPLTEKEQRFADWAESRGLVAVFSKSFPLEDDEQPFEPYFTYELGIESFANGRVIAQFTALLTGPDFPDCPPEVWELQERLLRHALENTKAEALSV